MSVCRFSPTCDLYVYVSAQTHNLHCCGCIFGWCTEFATWQGFVDHVLEHGKAGHQVPERILAEAKAELDFCEVALL